MTASSQVVSYLAEIQAWTGAGVETLRVATLTKSTSSFDTPANTIYDGRISDPGSIKRSIADNNATFGQASADLGFLELNNVDGRLDPWIGYGFGREIIVKELSNSDNPVSGATVLFNGIVIGIETSDALRSLRLRLRTRLTELDQPLLSTRYAGTTTVPAASASSFDKPQASDISDTDSITIVGATAEGDETLKDKIKPFVFGSCSTVEGVLVNKFLLLYQFAANPGGVTSIVVSDGGSPLLLGPNFGDLDSLCNAALDPASYGTCFARGIARLADPPDKIVTADVVEGATQADRSASRIAQRMLALVSTISSGDIGTATFDAFHAFRSAEQGIVIADDTKAGDAIGRIVSSAQGSVIPDAQGVFQSVWNDGPQVSASVKTLTLRELLDGSGLQLFAGPTSEGQGVPAWSIIVKWGRVWRVMTGGDLVGAISGGTDAISLALKEFYGTEFRQAKAQDTSVKTAFPLAGELTFETTLIARTDAEALANELLELFSVRRDRLTFETFFDDGDAELGQTVTVRIVNPGRIGMSAGKFMLVTGREDDLKKRTKTLTLWG